MICTPKHIFAVAVILLVLGDAGVVNPQTPTVVTLTSSASPSSGEPGVTIVNVIGANFPSGTILPASVTVRLQPADPGHPTATTTATSVATIEGSARRVYFLVPSSLIVSTPTAYEVSISGTTTTGTAFASGNTASLTVTPPAQISVVSPGAGSAGQTLSVNITGIYSVFTPGATEVSFGAGISVGGSAEGAFGPVTVNSTTSATAQLKIDAAAAAGSRTVIAMTGAEQASLANGFSVTPATTSITGFSPGSGPIGTLVTASGTNFISSTGGGPQVTLNKLGGGTILAPVSAFTATTATFVVPDGAATGPVTLTVGTQSVTSTSAFIVTTSSSFSLNFAPGSGTLIQGQSVAFTISLSSKNGFSSLAALSVSGIPSGVRSSFAPAQITAGQTSVLTLSAPANQSLGKSALSVSASAMINGQTFAQSVGASLQITGVTTTFLGRTVVDDTGQEPIAGVTVKFLGVDDKGNVTGCSGQTTSDAAGNFMLAQLPTACTGPQLIGYDGSTATSPPGKYAGVNLSYTLTSSQVTSSPVLIHLPRIDNAETVQVKQNATTNQIFNFQSIPGLTVTVYAGTTFTLDDGSQPNPFPLVAVQIPLDRLPDMMPTSGMLTPFIVAFQPANAVSSQPVAIAFPNPLNINPGISVTFVTLDPTRGFMVPYGTGTVSNDGTQFLPNPDPAHPGHGYGLVHFDWHGPMAPPPAQSNPCALCSPKPEAGKPVDLSSGLEVINSTDIAIEGLRGSILIQRTYRTATINSGPFGIGTGHNYGYELGTSAFVESGAGVITLVMPDGNQFPFNVQPNGTFTNSTIPSLLGAVLIVQSSGLTYRLRWKDGTIFQFTSIGGSLSAFLTGITDPNGNTITLTRNPSDGLQLTQVTDPVGRSLNFSYDTLDRITSITDSVGRSVSYTYNPQDTLATFTDAAGGITHYTYDTNNNLLKVVDPRHITIAQNTYDQNQRVTQQVEADGGVYQFAYTLLDPLVPTSPILLTTVTDPLGNQTAYRFTPQGFLLEVIDASGQTRSFNLAPGTNLVLSMTGGGSCDVCGDPTQGDLSFTYDVNGNMLTQTDALGNTTTFTYDPTFNDVNSATDQLGNTTRFTYDSNGNPLTVTDANGKKTAFTYNSFGLPIASTDPLNQTTTFVYDIFANLRSSTDPLGKTKQFAYDLVSRLTESTDSLGRKSDRVYDALDRMISRTNPQGNSIQFTYDAVGDLIAIIDERGNTTLFTYDGLKRLLTRTDPRGKVEFRSYDRNGNLVKLVDRRGQTTQFNYDVVNRMINASFQNGSAVARAYDANGRQVHVMDSVAGAFDFIYDRAGRQTSSSTQFGFLQYAYDPDSRMISRQVAGQTTVRYSYDPVGNLLSAVMPQASVNFTYDARNQVLGVARANRFSSAYTRDAVGRILSLIDTNGSKVLNSMQYAYDSVGNLSSSVSSIAQPLTTQPMTSQFDVNNRLTQSSSGTATTAYTYDDNGNRISRTDSTGTTSYLWDSRNRLVSIAQPNGQKTSFIYDPGRNLISQSDSGPTLNQTRSFVLDRLTNVAYVSHSDGNNVSTLTGQRVDGHLAIVHSNGQTEYGLTDALNSTTTTVDQSGKLLASILYDSFGQTTSNGSDYPFQYTGRVPVNGDLYNYRARYYDSQLKRFISEDPFLLSGGGTNLYSYVANSPETAIDPTGLWGVGAQYSVDLGIGVGGAATGGSVSVGFVGFPNGAVTPFISTTKNTLALPVGGGAGYGPSAIITTANCFHQFSRIPTKLTAGLALPVLPPAGGGYFGGLGGTVGNPNAPMEFDVPLPVPAPFGWGAYAGAFGGDSTTAPLTPQGIQQALSNFFK